MTIGQQIKWDFKTNGNLEIKDTRGYYIYSENSNGWSKLEYDSQGNQTYWENSDGNWVKREYDSKDNQIYFENSIGFWAKHEYDSKNNQIYYETSNGFWVKYEYDSQGNQIYYENSKGKIVDNRPKPSEDRVIEIDGIKYKLTKL
jgi:hypothetical protein